MDTFFLDRQTDGWTDKQIDGSLTFLHWQTLLHLLHVCPQANEYSLPSLNTGLEDVKPSLSTSASSELASSVSQSYSVVTGTIWLTLHEPPHPPPESPALTCQTQLQSAKVVRFFHESSSGEGANNNNHNIHSNSFAHSSETELAGAEDISHKKSCTSSRACYDEQ